MWYYTPMCNGTSAMQWLELDMRIGRARFHRALFEFHGGVRLCRTLTSSHEIESELKRLSPYRERGEKERSRFYGGGSSASLRPSRNRKKPAISALLQPSKIGVNRGIEYCVGMAKSHSDRWLDRFLKKLQFATCCA
jgi:hypothetical protein